MPLPPKPPGRRQRRNQTGVGLVAVREGDLPALRTPPTALLKPQQEAWEAFWRSPLAGLVMDADLPALHRLFRLRDEWQRCFEASRGERLVSGSTEQMVLHPLYKHMTTLEKAIESLEAQFGLTPLARLKLGVTFGEAKRSIAEINAAAAAEEGEESDEELFGGLIEAVATDVSGR